jgi:hypothetical protein
VTLSSGKLSRLAERFNSLPLFLVQIWLRMVSIYSPAMAKCLVLPLFPQASMPAHIVKRGFKGVSENGSLGKGLGSGFKVLQIPIQLHHHGSHGKGRIMSKSSQAMEEFGAVEHKSATTETLELLEWPRLCRALASFAATTLGKEQLHVCIVFHNSSVHIEGPHCCGMAPGQMACHRLAMAVCVNDFTMICHCFLLIAWYGVCNSIALD